MRRWSRAIRRRFENRTSGAYSGELLYPCGPAHIGGENRILGPSYSFIWSYDKPVLIEQLPNVTEKERETLEALQMEMHGLGEKLNVIQTVHTVGGRGYTHSIPNYGRVLQESLSEYSRCIARHLDVAYQRKDVEQIDLYLGLRDVLAGIERWHAHILSFLTHVQADNPVVEARRKRLLAAYEQLPFHPARNFLRRWSLTTSSITSMIAIIHVGST